jgi:hypothetical protein
MGLHPNPKEFVMRYLACSVFAISCVSCAVSHPSAPVAANLSPQLPVICRLEQRDRTIVVLAGPHGPIYSVEGTGQEWTPSDQDFTQHVGMLWDGDDAIR